MLVATRRAVNISTPAMIFLFFLNTTKSVSELGGFLLRINELAMHIAAKIIPVKIKFNRSSLFWVVVITYTAHPTDENIPNNDNGFAKNLRFI